MDMSVSWSPPPRQLMAYLALVPSEVAGKGLARAGNARVRRGMIQLAWRILMFSEGKRTRVAVPLPDG